MNQILPDNFQNAITDDIHFPCYLSFATDIITWCVYDHFHLEYEVMQEFGLTFLQEGDLQKVAKRQFNNLRRKAQVELPMDSNAVNASASFAILNYFAFYITFTLLIPLMASRENIKSNWFRWKISLEFVPILTLRRVSRCTCRANSVFILFGRSRISLISFPWNLPLVNNSFSISNLYQRKSLKVESVMIQ